MIVSKFGGSSVKDAYSILNCLSILEQDSQRRVAVISASGKTTNELERVWNSQRPFELIKDIFNKHRDMARDLGVYHSCQIYIDGLQKEALDCLNQKTLEHVKDQFLSLGERLSSFIFYRKAQEVLAPREVVFGHAFELIHTNSFYGEADPILDKTNKTIKSTLDKLCSDTLFITQGFLGHDSEKRITTLGREGSDFSASLFASAMDAHLLEIWTDVDGIYNRDPHTFENAIRLDHLSYEQADILAKSGMKVLYKRTMEPINKDRTKVFVGQTSAPNKGGTIISYEGDKGLKRLGMSLNESIVQINLNYKADISSEEHGLDNVKSLLEQCRVHPLLLSHKMIVLEKTSNLEVLTSRLKEFCHIDVFIDQLMINLIGQDLLVLEDPLQRLIIDFENMGKSFEIIDSNENLIRLMTSSLKNSKELKPLEELFFGP